jgi:hypothetical protein
MALPVAKKLELPKGNLGPNFTRKVIPWIEIFWHSRKRYPTDTELAQQFGWNAEEILRVAGSKFFNNCLKQRGIRRSDSVFLTEKQVACISLVTNFADPRSVSVKLAGIGVTSEMYNGWMQDSQFKRELAARADDILDNVYPEAQAAFAKKVRSGDMVALKFYYEMTGRANSPEAINVKMTMARLIEAVQKHVRDPAILAAIAAELSESTVAAVPVAEIPSTPSLRANYMAHLKETKNGN